MNRSRCEKCRAWVPAERVERDGKVYLAKRCPTCGPTEAYISASAERTHIKRALDPGYPHNERCEADCLNCTAHRQPTYAFVDVTNRCNLQCPMCADSVPGHGFVFDPPIEHLEKVFQHLAHFEPRPTIALFGGEPTVRRDIVDIVRLSAKKYGFKTRLLTNGLRLADAEFAEALLQARAHLLISYDGSNPRTYHELRNNAKALEHKGQLASAEKLMRSCLALRPQDETTCNSLGDLLFKMRQWDAAIREFEEAIRRDPDYFLPYANLVLVHAERKDVQSAEAVLNRCLARGPLPAVAEARLWKHLGVACERAGQREASLTNYTKAIALDPRDPTLYRNRSILLAALGRHVEAASDIATAQALAPKDGELHYVQGNHHAERQELTEALAAYSRALELAPRLRSARYNRGVILRRLRRFPEALDDQTRCLAETPPTDPLLKDILLERALNLANLRDYRAALDDLDTLLVQDRSNVAALITRGKLHADLGRDLVRSEEDLTLAIHLDPREPEAYRSRGLTRFRAENWYGSIADYRQYLKLMPNAPDATGIWNDISIAELNLQHKSEALAALERAESAGPTAVSRTNRGNIHLQSGDVQAALDDFNQAIQLDPDHARAWALRGQVRLREGRFDEAATDLRKALGSGNALYETMLLAGLALHRAGKKEEARQLLLTVARDRPEHPRGRLAQAVLDLDEKHYAAAISGLSWKRKFSSQVRCERSPSQYPPAL